MPEDRESAACFLEVRIAALKNRVGDYMAKPFWRGRFGASLFETSRKA